MVSFALMAAGGGIVVASTAFFRLADSDETELTHLVLLEYGFAGLLLLVGLGVLAYGLLG
ncbi:site-specific recombinase [Halarchaeum rubridurum]|uniref:Site-specific recombinase n=1 Tax=Halarchaeum rubridurum TaxID=489911 RepID=A0A830G1J3_9EURY|nr:hypothetical protein [Halarchaeum rubridurum]MBP1954911.1 site-specific recombinase [Halarchaeum rubridurum]GGM70423.1 hypothetical protein GCM10009017_20790 [Halarchaeum rubridurum]